MNRFTITKAAAPSVSGGHPAVTVINGLAKTYELELTEALLPKLSDPCKYGSISYSWKGSYLTDGYEKSTVEVVEENGQYKLKLIVPAVDYDKEASSGTIDITVVSDNYADFTLSIGLKTRNKAIPVPDGTISASEITYGQPLSASTITGRMKHPDTGAEITGTFSWEDGTLQFDAGDREANWIFTPDEPEYAAATGTVTVKVNPKSIEGATVTLEDTFEYDGTEKEPKIISVVLDGVPLTGPGQDKDYGYSYDRATNAGTYPLVIGGQNNYTGRLTFTWTLKAREVTPTITVADGIYNGGAPVEPAVTLTDDLDNTISETEYSVSYTNNTNAGTGTVTITDKAGGNYALGTASKDFNIAKAASEVTAAPTANTLTYNGENQALVTAGTANGGTMVYSLSKTGGYSNQIPTGKDAATYTVYYKVSGDDNHNDTAPQRVTVTIQKASVTVTAENKSTRVGYALSELTYTCVPAPFAGDAFTGALACSADKDTVGTSEITQGTLSLGDNYTITFVKGTYTVEKKLLQNEFRFSDSARTATYGDADFTLAAVGAAEGSTVTYSSTNERVAVVDDNGLVHILKAGETTITAVASETADYARGIASCTLVVAPKTLTSRDLEWTGGALTKVYDGTTAADGITVAVKASSLVGTDTLSITGSAVYNSADVDKASEIRFTPNAITEGNYRLAASEVLTISGASITQATPSYTAPSGLTATYGQTLSDVHLPGGWSWENSSTSVGGASASAKTFKATFTPDDTINYKTVTGIDVALLVNKAAGGSLGETALSQKYTDEQEHFFEADWSGLPEGQSWIFGSMYRRGEGSNAQLPRLENTVDGSKLVYVISGGKTGDTVTITFQASCENYETFTITLRITLRDRDAQAALTVTGADTVVYGQTLTLGVSGGSGTGAVTFSVKNETGEAGIDPDSGVLTPVKVGSVTVTATKAGDSEYNEAVSAPFTVTITKAASTGEPGYTRITTGGKTLADANLTLTGSTLNPNAGTLEWVDGDGNVLPGQTKVEANKRYKWRFTPADGNYDVLTGEIELYHVYIGGSTASVITVPVSSEQETVKVDAEVSGSTASVKITDRQLEQVISDGETVTVDVSGLKNVDSAKLPASAVEKIEQSGAELTVRMPNGSVSLDAKALAALGNAGDVTVSIRQAALTNAQQESIGKRAQVAAAVDVDVTAGRVKQDSFGGGRLTVSIPYTPKSGEDVSQLTVWLIRDDGSTENLGGQYDAKTGCFVFQTGRSARYLLVNAAGAQQFADVPASAYFADAVAWAQENGITNGIGSGLFGVNAPCTRAQAVTFLWRAAGSPAPETAVMPFTDVPVDSYYYSAVLWAVENGIAKGTSSTTFGPGASCTRAQIVTFLYRAFGSPADSSVAFADIAPNAYYADAVRWAVAAGVTTGTSRTAFSPNADCTRAQIVTFLWRCKK